MEIKVKAVDAVPEKSAVEVEEALLKKHEEEQHRKHLQPLLLQMK